MKVKMWIARRLDFKDKCWASLALWAMGYKDFGEAWSDRQICKDEFAVNDRTMGYCGKCEREASDDRG